MKESNWDSYWGEEKELEHWQKPADSIIEFVKACSSKKHPRVLDLGCGIGRHSLLFAKEGFEVTALDSSEQALGELKNKVEKLNLNIEIVKGNYLEPIFKSNSFDIILSYNVIYHGHREDFEKAINLCKKYLETDGILFFTCPTRDDGKYSNGKKVAPHTYETMNSVHPGDIHYFANESDIRQLVEDFSIISLNKNEHYWNNDGTKQFSSYWELIVKNE